MKKLYVFVIFTFIMLDVFSQVTDEQVVNMLQNARQRGMGQQEMIIMLTQKGVTQEQLMRIKEKYASDYQGDSSFPEIGSRMRTGSLRQQNQNKNFNQTHSTSIGGSENGGQYTIFDSLNNGMKLMNRPEKKGKPVFGRNIFNTDLLTFEPNLNIATPENYVLGPGDEVIVDIWGDAEQTFRQQISPDGTITDVKIGPVFLTGISVKEANARLKNAFSRIYSTMGGSNPTTFIRLSLGNIRSIRVNVMGEVEWPGTYTLPSLASLFHVLYSAGGMNEIGSLRKIKVSRNGKVLETIDLYGYLLEGKSRLDLRLEDGDVIIVSPYQNLVTLKGKVKRPMIYELKDDEKVADLLNYAGGFTGDAYKKAVRIIRKSGREYQVYNVEAENFGQFALTDGDEVSVDAVINRYENRVEIRGAVYRGGMYAIGEDVNTVKQLINKAEGVRGDAFLNRAVLYREKADRTMEVVALDVKGILENTVADIGLRINDVLYIPSIFDLKEGYTVRITGEVGIPGVYDFARDMSVEDLIIQAGGLKEAASVVKIDVSRRIKDPKSTSVGNVLAESYTLTLKDGLVVDGKAGFQLMPFDEVFVRRSPRYQEQQHVRVTGEVLYSGQYVLARKGERLSDLVRKAGGLNPDAYVTGARLTRKLNEDERRRVETLLKFSKQDGKDSIDLSRLNIGESYYVGIQLAKALSNPGSEYDIILREGDVLNVPEYNGTVKVSGAVMYPNTVVYEKGADLQHYIEQGGGFAHRAKKRKVFIVYMNGTVSKSKTFAKARIEPGCEVIVPVKPPRKGGGLAEMMSIATSTTSMAALVTSIINSTK